MVERVVCATQARLSLLLTGGLLLAGCAWQPEQPNDAAVERIDVSVNQRSEPALDPSSYDAGIDLRRAVVSTATSMVGTPYRYGGTTPKGFDCSGLVLFAYDAVGVSLPRTSLEQFRTAQAIELDELRPGDLLFYKTSGRRVSHVGIYVGDQQFVHAPSTGGEVQVLPLNDPWYRRRFAGAGRVVNF